MEVQSYVHVSSHSFVLYSSEPQPQTFPITIDLSAPMFSDHANEMGPKKRSSSPQHQLVHSRTNFQILKKEEEWICLSRIRIFVVESFSCSNCTVAKPECKRSGNNEVVSACGLMESKY
jgi:hypothetical protein